MTEYDEQGNELRSYGWQPDSMWGTNPLWLKEDGIYYWYQNDHLGTPHKLIDSTGTVVWSATYTAFGEAQIQTETITNNLRFPGQYFDAETGLHYNFHRYYDPEIGRYLRTDPIGFDGGDENLYAYVGNDSINNRDASGLQTGLEIAVGFCFANPEICLALGYGISVGICTATGWCQPFPLDALLPPSLPPLDIPSFDTPYPDLRPPSLLFPRLPSLPETCDPFPLQDPSPLLEPFPMHKNDPLFDLLMASSDEKIAEHALRHGHFKGKTVAQMVDIIDKVRENGTPVLAGNGKVLTRLGDIVLIDDPFMPDAGTIFERVGNMTKYIRKFLRDNP